MMVVNRVAMLVNRVLRWEDGFMKWLAKLCRILSMTSPEISLLLTLDVHACVSMQLL